MRDAIARMLILPDVPLLRTTFLLALAGLILLLVLRRDRYDAFARCCWCAVLLLGWLWLQVPCRIPWHAAPVSQPVTQSVSQPLAQPIAEPVAQRVAQIPPTPIPMLPTSPRVRPVEAPEVFDLPVASREPFAVHETPPDEVLHDAESPLVYAAPSGERFAETTVIADRHADVAADAETPAFEPARRVVVALFVVWLFGMAAIVLRWCYAYVRFLLLLRRTVPADAEAVAMWDAVLAERNLAPGRIAMRFSDRLGPSLAWTPRGYRLLMSREVWDDLSPAARTGILRHELAHYRRRDAWKSLAVRLLALPHWFNPVAHMAVRKFDEAAECLCDEAAYADSPEGRRAFAETLLVLHESVERYVAFRPALWGNGLKYRITHLLNFEQRKELSPMRKFAVLTIVAAMLAVGLFRIELVARETAPETPAQETSALAQETTDTPPPETKVSENLPENMSDNLPEDHAPWCVYGTVRFADGKPMANSRIGIAVAPDVLDRGNLKITTDENGNYTLPIPLFAAFREEVSEDEEAADAKFRFQHLRLSSVADFYDGYREKSRSQSGDLIVVGDLATQEEIETVREKFAESQHEVVLIEKGEPCRIDIVLRRRSETPDEPPPSFVDQPNFWVANEQTRQSTEAFQEILAPVLTNLDQAERHPWRKNVSVSLRFPKEEIMVGEPTYFEYVIHNDSDTDIQFMVGGDYRNSTGRPTSFTMRAIRTDGDEEKIIYEIPETMGMGGIITGQEIPTGDEYVFQLCLPFWLELSEPGEYRIEVARSLSFTAENINIFSEEAKSKTASVPSIAATTLVVKPTEHETFGKMIAAWGEQGALDMLIHVDDERAIPWLIQAVETDNDSTRYRVKSALLKFNDDRALEVLQRGIDSTDIDEARSAVWNLARSKHPGAVDILLEHENHPYASVRLAIVYAAEGMPLEAALPLLRRHFDDPGRNGDVGKEARKIYMELTTTPIEVPEDHAPWCVYGTVHDVDGKPVANCYIKASDAFAGVSNVKLTTRTDENGYYMLPITFRNARESSPENEESEEPAFHFRQLAFSPDRGYSFDAYEEKFRSRSGDLIVVGDLATPEEIINDVSKKFEAEQYDIVMVGKGIPRRIDFVVEAKPDPADALPPSFVTHPNFWPGKDRELRRIEVFRKIIFPYLADSGEKELLSLTDKISTSLRFPKREIMVGEPIDFEYVVRNDSDTDLWVEVGGDYRGSGRPTSFTMRAIRTDGVDEKIVYEIPVTMNMGGIMYCEKIPAGGEYAFPLCLPRWLELTEPGEYRIEAARWLPLSTENMFSGAEKPSKVSVLRIAAATLTVQPAEHEAFGKMIDAWGELATSTDSSYDEREKALDMLAHIEDERAIPWLVKAAEDHDSGTAKSALAKFNDDRALEAIRRDLDSSDSGKSHSAAVNLARSKHPDAIGILLEHENHPNYSVRLVVVQAARKMPLEVALPMLERHFNDPGWEGNVGEEARRIHAELMEESEGGSEMQ